MGFPQSIKTLTPSSSILIPNFPTANKKIAAVKGGTGNMRALAFGNSKVWGTTNTVGTNPPGPGGNSWPSKMVTMLTALGISSVGGASIPQADNLNVPATDTRWVTASGWISGYETYPTFLYGVGGASSWLGSVGASDMSFTPGAAQGNVDSFDIYYPVGPGLGTFKVAVDAASSTGTTIVTAAASNGIGKTTINVASGSAHVVNIGSITVAAIGIVMIDPYLSTAFVARIGNCGVVGNSAFQQADLFTNSAVATIALIKAYAPDLTIINQGGTIDGLFQFSPATVIESIAMIAAAANASGDVLLCSETPTLPLYGPSLQGSTLVLEQQVASLLPGLALTNNYGFVDLYNMMFPQLAQFQAQGYYNFTLNSADQFHLSPTGNGWVAYQIAKAFTQI